MEDKFISSMQNPLIKNITLLQKKKSERKKQGLFIVEGIKTVREIPENYAVENYILSENFNKSLYFKREDKLFLEQEKVVVVKESIYKSISDTQTPQGIMALVKQKVSTLESVLEKENTFGIVLENMQDPGNLGTVIRSAYGLGLDYLILSKGCVDVFSPKTIRASMGAIFHIPIVIEEEIETIAEALASNGAKLYVTEVEKAKEIFHVNFTGKVALLIGNEANGASEFIKSKADERVYIPMPSGLESFNASIAASICMYEGMKQRYY